MSLLEPTVLYTASDGAELAVRRNLSEWNGDESIPTDEIDRMEALWQLPGGGKWDIDTVENGRLLAGLWERCGPFGDVSTGAVPIEVATGATADLAAYLYLGLDRGRGRSRKTVADQLEVSKERTVSNYLVDVRLAWTDLS